MLLAKKVMLMKRCSDIKRNLAVGHQHRRTKCKDIKDNLEEEVIMTILIIIDKLIKIIQLSSLILEDNKEDKVKTMGINRMKVHSIFAHSVDKEMNLKRICSK